MKLKFGLFLDPFYLSGTFHQIKNYANKAEHLGYESIWVSDHLMSETKPIYECFTTLSSLASVTRKIRLGSLVACNSYRNPSLLAKICATLDVISNGRLEFGVGAGWNREEYNAYGFSFPKGNVRIAQLAEALDIIRSLWTEEKASYKGRYFKIENATCEPKPVQKPYPPITIGGSGERLMLKTVAKYANRSNWKSPLLEFKLKLKILKNHCTRIGRNYNDIEKSLMGRVLISEKSQELKLSLHDLYMSGLLHLRNRPTFNDWFKKIKSESFVGSISECAEKIEEFANLGVKYFMLTFMDFPKTDSMEAFANQIIKEHRF